MALIKCPECRKEISDQAEVCIHCGYPIKKNQEKQGEITQEDESDIGVATSSDANNAGHSPMENAEEKKKRIRNAVIAIVIVVGIIVIFVAVVEYTNHAYTRAQRKADQAYQNYQSLVR